MALISAAERGDPHLVLIGLMGAGKTAVGRIVADALGWPLVDVDAAIVERTGRTTRQLWEAGGEAAYRPLEREITVGALAGSEPQVIGVPAGVAMEPAGQERIDRTARLVVWLRADVTTLVERVRSQDHRPLVDEDPAAILGQQVTDRSVTYERLADLVLDVEDRTPLQLADRIVAEIHAQDVDGWIAPPNADLWGGAHRPTPFQERVVEQVRERGTER